MSEQKLTPEFPPHIKPVRDGVYQVRIVNIYHPNNLRYSRWWRGRWRFTADNAAEARKEQAASYDCQSQYFAGWRGLAKPPKSAKATLHKEPA